MSYQYKVKTKKYMLDGKNQQKYFAVPSRFRMVETSEISRTLENRSTLTRADIYANIVAITDLIMEHLTFGNSVRIEGLGVFSLSVTSEGYDDPTEITPRRVMAKKICFKAAPELQQQLKKVEFTRSKKP